MMNRHIRISGVLFFVSSKKHRSGYYRYGVMYIIIH